MSNTVNSFNAPISINDLARDIALVGHERSLLIKGEPGVGKSDILKSLKKILGEANYNFIYFDCPLKDVGDTWMNIPVHDQKRLEQYISDQFDFSNGKPFVVMLDEFMKAPKMMQVMFTRMVQERTVGDRPMPVGSIVFATSNNAAEGCGDTILAHGINRLTEAQARKPNANEWCIWASDNGISGTVRAWAATTKKLFDSYTTLSADELKENPYIFNPKKPVGPYASPRSIAASDSYVRRADRLGERLGSYLCGTIGEAAASSLYSFVLLEKEIFSTAMVVNDPHNTPIPTKTAALFIMMFNAIDDLLTQDDLNKFMQYVQRVGHREVEAIFFTMLVQTKKTMKLAKHNTTVMAWAASNVELFI
jgi:hypothetical protein